MDLVSAGLVRPPLRIVRTYRGHELEARITEDGSVAFDGRSYPSLSAAAVAAIKSARPGREESAINGWQFWKFVNEQGGLSKMDALRAKMAEVAEGPGE